MGWKRAKEDAGASPAPTHSPKAAAAHPTAGPRGTFRELGLRRPGLSLAAIRSPPEEGHQLGRETQHGAASASPPRSAALPTALVQRGYHAAPAHGSAPGANGAAAPAPAPARCCAWPMGLPRGPDRWRSAVGSWALGALASQARPRSDVAGGTGRAAASAGPGPSSRPPRAEGGGAAVPGCSSASAGPVSGSETHGPEFRLRKPCSPGPLTVYHAWGMPVALWHRSRGRSFPRDMGPCHPVWLFCPAWGFAVHPKLAAHSEPFPPLSGRLGSV